MTYADRNPAAGVTVEFLESSDPPVSERTIAQVFDSDCDCIARHNLLRRFGIRLSDPILHRTINRRSNQYRRLAHRARVEKKRAGG